jgi:hypothetical protein
MPHKNKEEATAYRKAYYEGNKEKMKARSKSYYESNKEKISIYARAYRTDNKEKIDARIKIYREANKERRKATDKAYYEKNKERVKAKAKAYYENNRDKYKEWREDNKDYGKEWRKDNIKKIKATGKEWYEAHKKRINSQHSRWAKKRYASDPIYKLRMLLATSLRHGLKRIGSAKIDKTSDILKCSFKEFKAYIEDQFQEGMSWENHGRSGWELDHIVPLSLAKTGEEVRALSHYSNFQPLWAEENGPANKGTKLIPILISPENKIRYAEIITRNEAF